MAKKMRAVQVSKPKGPFEIVERDIPEPQAGWVRVKVHACGICHSDSLTKDGTWPGIQYPRIPGHEVIGIIDAIGSGVAEWTIGQRVGVGWHGGHCGHCDSCRRGDFFACQVSLLTTGISFDGGYAEYMVTPAKALALVPDDLSSVESAPLMCAGLTTFNALRNSGARSGDVVGVLGIGAAGPIPVNPILLINGKRSVKGWYSGTSIDSQDTLKFSASAGVQSMNEIYPLEKANEAYERMMSGKARFRVVLTMGS